MSDSELRGTWRVVLSLTRQLFQAVRLLAGIAWLVLAGATLAQDGSSKPNFILIMADDLGFGDLGCFGHKEIKTPNLDRLAAAGVKFTDFYSNGAVCSPTRAALMTGRYQQRVGIQGVITAANHREAGMSLTETTFAELLKGAGYATGMFGKWHLGYPASFNPTKQGFDVFEGFVSGNVDYHSHVDQATHQDWWQQDELKDRPGYITDLINQRGSQFVRRNKEKPFCLYLAHGAPHYPYQGRKDPAFRKAGEKRPNEAIKDFDRRYKEMIEVMDEGIGELVKAVQESGLEKKTLIVFMSDNGASAKAIKGIASVGKLRGSKGTLWEGGIRVPCIASWPGTIKPGSSTNEVCLSMDWLPTMASLAGIKELERAADGIDLTQHLRSHAPLPPRTIYWATGKMKAARQGTHKLVVQGASTSLFDLSADIAEARDLSAENPTLKASLTGSLEMWESEVWDGVAPVAR